MHASCVRLQCVHREDRSDTLIFFRSLLFRNYDMSTPNNQARDCWHNEAASPAQRPPHAGVGYTDIDQAILRRKHGPECSALVLRGRPRKLAFLQSTATIFMSAECDRQEDARTAHEDEGQSIRPGVQGR